MYGDVVYRRGGSNVFHAMIDSVITRVLKRI